MPDIDALAVMAEHEGDHWCNEGGRPNMGVRLTLLAPPCLPYRLAEALTNGLPQWERARLQDALSEERGRAIEYLTMAEINAQVAARMEAERDEACEAILRVEAFVEQLQTEKFWIGLGGSPVAAIATRIRADLKPRP